MDFKIIIKVIFSLLNAFKYAVNHPDGKLYKKAHKKKVSIQNIRKGKILLLD